MPQFHIHFHSFLLWMFLVILILDNLSYIQFTILINTIVADKLNIKTHTQSTVMSIVLVGDALHYVCLPVWESSGFTRCWGRVRGSSWWKVGVKEESKVLDYHHASDKLLMHRIYDKISFLIQIDSHKKPMTLSSINGDYQYITFVDELLFLLQKSL